ncbi:MAG: VCBS repeat-containing protein [Planctomycetes bacterium]|nr:VCBS repeat-containing protein [Planctomycetota bacterium]
MRRFFVLASLFATGCGSGSAGIVSAIAGSGSGGGNAPADVSNVEVAEGRTSPATIRFELTDAESDPVDVSLVFFRKGSSAAEEIANLVADPARGIDTQLLALQTSRPGRVHEKLWDFVPQLGPGFSPEIRLEVRIVRSGHSTGTQVTASESRVVSLGNDAPEVRDVTLPGGPEIVGIADVDFVVSDSSSDLISVTIEYDVLDDVPDRGRMTATPAGDAPTQIVTSPDGTPFTFFWDVVADLGRTEHEVALYLTPSDGDLIGKAPPPATVRVDNNSEPIAFLGEGSFLLNTDPRRGIPIPITVVDRESDPVDVAVQWRREGEAFVTLPQTAAAIRAALDDPLQRKRLRIATEKPRAYEGSVVATSEAADPDGTRARLPELASTAAGLLASGVVAGRRLEILRATNVPAPIGAEEAGHPLASPVAALPVESGPTALVLDRPVAGSWRLREVDVATGAVVREIAVSPLGDPSAMTWERGRTSVLVASIVGSTTDGVWVIQRVIPSSPATPPELLVRSDDPSLGPFVESGVVRGVASVGADACLVTVGSSVVEIHFPAGVAPTAAALPLAAWVRPWGIAVDPRDPNRVYVADNGRDRVAVLDLRSLAADAVQVNGTRSTPCDDAAGIGFPGPRALALERAGTQLLVVTDDPTRPGLELRGVSVGRDVNRDEDAGNRFDDREGFEITAGLLDATSIASGPDDFRILASRGPNDLIVVGGLTQSRTILAYEPRTQTVVVDAPFSPRLENSIPPARWRILDRVSPLRGDPAGATRVFVWDTEDTETGGPVFLRVVPIDSEQGTGSQTSVAKSLLGSLQTDPAFLFSTSLDAVDCGLADLDGDGDIDVATANSNSDSLSVFFQRSPRDFDSPIQLFASRMKHPISLAAGDLDGDGRVDLVSGNLGDFGSIPPNVTIFRHTSRVNFGSPLELRHSSMQTPRVALGDLDGDGDMDVVTANGSSPSGDDTLTVFFQRPGGSFSPPLVLTHPGMVQPVDIAVGDLDGDGDLDLVSANGGAGNPTLTIWFQRDDAPGVFDFDPEGPLGGPGIPGGRFSVAIGDLDGDGDNDLAWTKARSGELMIFFQTEPGRFEANPRGPLGSPGVSGEPRQVVIADLDGDGDNDLVTSNGRPAPTQEGDVYLFFQTAPGVFEASRPTSFLEVPPGPVAAGDLDGDGHTDVVAGVESFDTRLRVFFQVTGIPSAPMRLTDPRLGDSLGVAAADLNGDGRLDLVTANSAFSTNSLTLFFQGSTPGEFLRPALEITHPLMSGPLFVTPVDLDGDGAVDLVTANRTSNNLTIFRQGAGGQFDSTPTELTHAAMQAPQSVAAADLNGDGRPDLASVNHDSPNVTVFFQTGSGGLEFDPEPRVLSGFNLFRFSSVRAVDLDGDGRPDLVVTGGNDVVVFYQTAPGEFEDAQVIGDAVGAETLDVVDVDADGFCDIVTSDDVDDDKLRVFFQTSSRVFCPVDVMPPPPSHEDDPRLLDGPFTVLAVDVDGDGDRDLVSANARSENVTVFVQTAPGAFASNPIILTAATIEGKQALVAADLDGDGDLDLTIAGGNLGRNSLHLFLGGR